MASTEAVDSAAEVGVILLLFTIGIEFSLDRLARVWRWIVLGGGAQVVLATGLTLTLVLLVGGDWRTGLFTGFLVALSSTAIVLTILAEKGQTNTVRGRLALAVTGCKASAKGSFKMGETTPKKEEPPPPPPPPKAQPAPVAQKPAPKRPRRARINAQVKRVEIDDKVMFATGKAELLPASLHLLR